LLPFITGQRVAAVTARVGVFGATQVGVEDGGTVILELSGGALATLTGGYWLPRWTSEWRWTIRGSERWVAWDPNRAGTGGAIEIHGPQPQFHAMEEVFTLPPDPTRGYAGRRCLALLREWIANANGSPSSARTTPESAIATLELIDAIQRSSREGRRIAVA
jgi:predicted dehydrogenase